MVIYEAINCSASVLDFIILQQVDKIAVTHCSMLSFNLQPRYEPKMWSRNWILKRFTKAGI